MLCIVPVFITSFIPYCLFTICISFPCILTACGWNGNKHRVLSSVPHLAGTPQEKKNAEMLAEQWESYGFDNVQIISYDVLLAYPNKDNPNKVIMMTLVHARKVRHNVYYTNIMVVVLCILIFIVLYWL